MIRQSYFYLALLALTTQPALAAECAKNLNTSGSTVKELLSCIVEMNQELESLKRTAVKLEDFTQEANPRHMVIAMDTPQGCPRGWTEFNEANGRFILGATSRNGQHIYLQKGGAEKVTLTERQMRAHQHVMFSNGSGANTDVRAGQTVAHKGYRRETGIDDVNLQYRLVGAGGSPNVGATSVSGKSEAFSVMPPYVALYFCKKD